MKLRCDEDFVEEAVLLCASNRREGIPSLQIHRFHIEREKCYSILDPDERNAAFFKLHLDWFREWGLEKLIVGLLDEFPQLPGALNVLAFRKARGKNEEAAELYVNAQTGRNAVVALRVERFEKDDLLARLLRHELTHLSDMVDPAFGYSPELYLRGPSPAQQRIVRERYRLLWDVTIDGRLSRASRAINSTREQHQALFDRAYSFWPEEKRREIFDEMWSGHSPKHAHLLALASDPRDLGHAHQPLPGASCPLCDFPTFDWADLHALSDVSRASLRAQFPLWTPDQGVCKRCVEIYELAGKFEVPATIVL
jgi:hypothetical protein